MAAAIDYRTKFNGYCSGCTAYNSADMSLII